MLWQALLVLSLSNWALSIAVPIALAEPVVCLRPVANSWYCPEFNDMSDRDLALRIWQSTAIISWFLPVLVYTDVRPEKPAPQRRLDDFL